MAKASKAKRAKRQTYTDHCESEAHRMHLIRDLVERLNDMGLGKLVPFPLIPEDHKGRNCRDRGYVPIRQRAEYDPAMRNAIEAFEFFRYEDLPSEDLCVRWLEELKEGVYERRTSKRTAKRKGARRASRPRTVSKRRARKAA